MLNANPTLCGEVPENLAPKVMQNVQLRRWRHAVVRRHSCGFGPHLCPLPTSSTAACLYSLCMSALQPCGVAHARLLCIHGHPLYASQVCHDYDPERNGIINSLNSCFPNSTTLHCPLDDAREWLCISLMISTVGQEYGWAFGQ